MLSPENLTQIAQRFHIVETTHFSVPLKLP